MTVGSLFAGIGGFDLAATRVFGPGSVRWQIEIDPWAQRVLAKHWPEVPRYSDIREVRGDELEPVDLVCGGFPCQDASVSNTTGEGIEGERTGLWRHFKRLLADLRPRWVLAENVPGLKSRGLDTVYADLEALDYTVGTLDLPAVAFGAPHVRHRLWIVAHALCSERWQEAERRNVAHRTHAGREEAAGGLGACAAALGCRSAGNSGSELVRRAQADLSRCLGEATNCTCGAGEGPFLRSAPCSTSAYGAGESELGPWRSGRIPTPLLCGVDDGLPFRLDRLRGLGNAIVPQVAEFLFRRILEADDPAEEIYTDAAATVQEGGTVDWRAVRRAGA